jgi:hypothetical protein
VAEEEVDAEEVAVVMAVEDMAEDHAGRLISSGVSFWNA